MSPKAIYILAATVGGTIGGFVPLLWGGSTFDGWSIILSMVGGFGALWLSYRYLV